MQDGVCVADLTRCDPVQCPHEQLCIPGQGTRGWKRLSVLQVLRLRRSKGQQEEAAATMDELVMFSKQRQK